MSVTITRVSAADLPCEVWTFPATEPPVHAVSKAASVNGGVSATGVRGALSKFSEVRAAVTITHDWFPPATGLSNVSRTKHESDLTYRAVFGAALDALVQLRDLRGDP